MKKITVKMILDLIMIVVFSLLFNKMVLGLTFHEAGGLALGVAVLIHLILNKNWVVGVTKKLFSRTLPVKTRISYLLNIILLVCFGLIIYSGIQISKVLFTSTAGHGGNFKNIHIMASYIALIVVGLHVGLHAKMIKQFCLKKVTPKLQKIIVVVLSLIFVINGGYQFSQSTIIRMFSEGGGERPEMHMQASTEDGTVGSSDVNSSDFQKPEGGEHIEGERPDGMEEGGTRPERPDGGGASISFTNVISVLFRYLSIAGLFAVISAAFDSFFQKRNKRRLVVA